MKKIDMLHAWLLEQGDWVYLRQVPFTQFSMSRDACSTALIALCNQGKADFRVIGLKQYKGVKS